MGAIFRPEPGRCQRGVPGRPARFAYLRVARPPVTRATTPAEFGRVIAADQKRFNELVRRLGVRPE
jgi:hypothetical protein